MTRPLEQRWADAVAGLASDDATRQNISLEIAKSVAREDPSYRDELRAKLRLMLTDSAHPAVRHTATTIVAELDAGTGTAPKTSQ